VKRARLGVRDVVEMEAFRRFLQVTGDPPEVPDEWLPYALGQGPPPPCATDTGHQHGPVERSGRGPRGLALVRSAWER
jgi:hypothetical protein